MPKSDYHRSIPLRSSYLFSLLLSSQLGLKVLDSVRKARLGIIDLEAHFDKLRVIKGPGPRLADGNDRGVLFVGDELGRLGPAVRLPVSSATSFSANSQSLEDLARRDRNPRNIDAPAPAAVLEVVLGHAEPPHNIAEHSLGAREVHGHVVEHGVVGARGDGAHARQALEGFADQARDEGRGGGGGLIGVSGQTWVATHCTGADRHGRETQGPRVEVSFTPVVERVHRSNGLLYAVRRAGDDRRVAAKVSCALEPRCWGIAIPNSSSSTHAGITWSVGLHLGPPYTARLEINT